jgi:hypothetical protein
MITREQCRSDLRQVVKNINDLLENDHNVHDMKELIILTSIKLSHLSFDLGYLWVQEVSAGIQRFKNK